MTQVLARKWRPRTFDELVGQEHVVRALKNGLERERLHHAYLFTGTRGVGKTTLARIIAKALNCETGVTATPCGQCGACREIDAGRFIDLIELDAASNTQVDNMREMLENALYAPTSGRFKVYIIDEVHMLSRNAFNAMLKTLEEPPAHVKFILATTDPQKIPVTVLSRCLQFNLKQIPQQQIKEQLEKILGREEIAFEEAALGLIARAAHGSLRDSLSLLDQAIAHGAGRVEASSVRAMLGAVEQEFLEELLAALIARDGAALIATADRIAERALSFESALQELAVLLHRIALVQSVPGAIADDDPQRGALQKMAASLSAEDVQLLYQIAIQGRQDLAFAPDDYAGFTMALLRMLAFAAPTQAAAIERVQSAPATSTPASVVKKKLIEGDWTALVNSLPLAGMERMLAHNCELTVCEGERIELRLPQAQRHLADRSYQERLKQALERHFGTRLRLDISVGAANGNTPAEIRSRELEQRTSQAQAAIDRDPFVRDLVEHLDAHVIPETVRPMHNGGTK